MNGSTGTADTEAAEVQLGGEPVEALACQAAGRARGKSVGDHLLLAAELGQCVPLPASGRTRQRWELLASVAAVDLTAARVLEAHVDALAILAEAGLSSVAGPGTTWGVFAAEGPGVRLDAVDQPGTGWVVSGTKPWCSLAGRLTHALVTAHVSGGRRLFAVPLQHPGVTVEPDTWHARGLVDVPSGPVHFEEVPAQPVGGTDWYLIRPGFAHGGIGVAACWYGGAVGLARALARSLAARPPDQLAFWHLGHIDLALGAARQALAAAAVEVDAGHAEGGPGEVLALRTRSAVAAAAETTITTVGHALGPAPLTLDAEHATRVADLTVYLRQHHAERDVARLGEMLHGRARLPW
ncbi:acyl-CoA dehydrogenase family protein [Oryzihumus sp.]|jgi:alkylation response protein AidB-like acyl-CoA dehydrogenase|uniref:acyl-CoA dehydrogenase family protein n=1 Tax=Oryzihumus sp. TaxID=1968903 RepID=UPI002ED9614C